MSDATGLGVTRRSGGRGPFLSASAGEAGLVFHKLPLSKARNSDKTGVAEGRAEEALRRVTTDREQNRGGGTPVKRGAERGTPADRGPANQTPPRRDLHKRLCVHLSAL